jgi:SAM-dependent methyltransferase
MHVYPCTNRAEFFAVNDGREFQERYALQLHIAKAHRNDRTFLLAGFCRLCNRSVDFLVDRKHGAQMHDGVWIPNWRERLVCPHCGLNNRQRALGWFIDDALRTIRHAKPVIYMMERRSPLYQDCVARYPQCEWIGGESLDGPVNLVVSNEVLEHAPEPVVRLREMYRLLAPEGVLLMTIPFCVFHDKNVERARMENGRVVHVMPPVCRENPSEPDGSLVFTDFGWEVLDQIRAVGFTEVEVLLYWSMVYGHLGGPLPLFRGRRIT